jgi:hypothetical protein
MNELLKVQVEGCGMEKLGEQVAGANGIVC